MFDGATSFNQPLNNWDVSKVASMTNMFTGAESFNQPLNKWNVSNVRYGALELELKFGVHVRYIIGVTVAMPSSRIVSTYSSATTHDVSAAPAPRPPEAMNMSDEEFDGVP